MVQISGADEDDKPHGGTAKGQSIETSPWKKHLELFKLPVTLGDYEARSFG